MIMHVGRELHSRRDASTPFATAATTKLARSSTTNCQAPTRAPRPQATPQTRSLGMSRPAEAAPAAPPLRRRLVVLGGSADAGCPWVRVTKRSICQRLIADEVESTIAGRPPGRSIRVASDAPGLSGDKLIASVASYRDTHSRRESPPGRGSRTAYRR
jgi:hypothetical protein